MLVIRAPAVCNVCQKVAAQGTIGGKPHCVSCALVGASLDSAIDPVHTNGIVTALLGPVDSRKDTLQEARRKLAAQVGDDWDGYNRFAMYLRKVVRFADGNKKLPAAGAAQWRVDGDALAMHGNHLYELWAAQKSDGARNRFAADTVEALLKGMGGNPKEYDPRALLVDALGPLSGKDRSIAPSMVAISDEVYDSMWEAVKHVNSVTEELHEALVRAWVTGLAAPTATDITLGEAIKDANHALSEPALYKFADRVLARSRMAADYLRDRYGAQRMDKALEYPISPDALAFATAAMTLADLKDKTLLKNVIDEAVGKLGSALGLPASDSRRLGASVMFTYLDGLRSDQRAPPALVNWVQSDLVGADALQTVDASLLRKAKEALQKKTLDKDYSIANLEKYLTQIWADKMHEGGVLNKIATTAAFDGMIPAFQQQVTGEQAERWRNFLLVAGTQFYRDGKPSPAPPAGVKMTQAEFVKKNLGSPNYTGIIRELTNMAEYYNRGESKFVVMKRAGGAKAITEFDGLGKTKNYNAVVGDLQTLRRNLIKSLQQMGETSVTPKGPTGKPFNKIAMVDAMLASLFQAMFEQLPEEVAIAEGTTFVDIMNEYKGSAGTAPRGNLISRFLKRK